MCEINIAFLEKGRENEGVKSLEYLNAKGNVRNADATGLFNAKYFKKMPSKINVFDSYEHLKKSRYAVIHNRYATNGYSAVNKNNHPFTLNKWRFCHNGVFTNTELVECVDKNKVNKRLSTKHKKIETDSFSFLKLFDYYYSISKKRTEITKIKEAIELSGYILGGWYSCILIDTEKDIVYYFKESVSKFYTGYKNNKLMLASTNENSLNELKQIEEIDEVIEVMPNILYKYDFKRKMLIQKCKLDLAINDSRYEALSKIKRPPVIKQIPNYTHKHNKNRSSGGGKDSYSCLLTQGCTSCYHLNCRPDYVPPSTYLNRGDDDGEYSAYQRQYDQDKWDEAYDEEEEYFTQLADMKDDLNKLNPSKEDAEYLNLQLTSFETICEGVLGYLPDMAIDTDTYKVELFLFNNELKEHLESLYNNVSVSDDGMLSIWLLSKIDNFGTEKTTQLEEDVISKQEASVVEGISGMFAK